MHLCVSKGPLQFFSWFLKARIHLNVEINKLVSLQQFSVRNTLFFSILGLFAVNKWIELPWGWYLCYWASLKKIKYASIFYLYISTFEILSIPPIVICSYFKMQFLGVLKLRNAYILPPGWCICSFHPFSRFFLKLL